VVSQLEQTSASLLDLVEPPEWRESNALIATVIDLNREAGVVHATLAGHVGQASLQCISRGPAAVKLDRTPIPKAGSED
jgi:hypothetical protein